MRLEEPNVNKYVNQISSSADEDDFKALLKNIREEVDPEEVAPSIRSDISQEEEHVALVRAISSGFHQSSEAKGSESGFKFQSTDPLHEEVETPADVLLVRDKDFNYIQVCLVACEVGDENVAEWISNINEIHEVFSDTHNRDVLKGQLNAERRQIESIQYITLVKEDDYQSIQFSELDDRCNPSEYAVWACYMDGVSDLCHEDGSLIHSDLRTTLDSCFDYDLAENPIEYTMGSDPIIPLQRVLFRLVRGKTVFDDDPEPMEFTRGEFKSKYQSKLELGCSKKDAEPLIADSVDELLNVATKIGICSKTQTRRDDRDYRIMYQGKDPSTAEEAARQKYIDFVSEIEAEYQAFNRAKEEFGNGDQSSLDAFKN